MSDLDRQIDLLRNCQIIKVIPQSRQPQSLSLLELLVLPLCRPLLHLHTAYTAPDSFSAAALHSISTVIRSMR